MSIPKTWKVQPGTRQPTPDEVQGIVSQVRAALAATKPAQWPTSCLVVDGQDVGLRPLGALLQDLRAADLGALANRLLRLPSGIRSIRALIILEGEGVVPMSIPLGR